MTQQQIKNFAEYSQNLLKQVEKLKNLAINQICEGVACPVKQRQIRQLFEGVDVAQAGNSAFISGLQAKIEAIKSQPDQPQL